MSAYSSFGYFYVLSKRFSGKMRSMRIHFTGLKEKGRGGKGKNAEHAYPFHYADHNSMLDTENNASRRMRLKYL